MNINLPTIDFLHEIEKIIKKSILLSCGIDNSDETAIVVLDEINFIRFKSFDYKNLRNFGTSKLYSINTQGVEITRDHEIFIFFLAPTVDNIRLLINFLKLIKKNIHSYHVVFTSIYLSINLVNRLFEIDEYSGSNNIYYHKIPLCVSYYDEQVLLINNSYYENKMDYFNDIECTIEYILNELNIKNNIVLSIGKNSISVSNKLISNLEYNNTISNNDFIASTILIDREYDLVTLMKLQKSIGGIVNEIFDANTKEIKINVDNRIVVIDKKSLIYRSIEYLALDEAHKKIKERIKEIQNGQKKIELKIKDGINNLDESDKLFIKTIDSRENECRNLITLISYLFDILNSDNYLAKIHLQELITSNILINYDIINKIINIAVNTNDLITSMRYLILYSQHNRGLSDDDTLIINNSPVQNKYKEWENILGYLKRQNIIECIDLRKYLLNIFKKKTLKNDTCLFSEMINCGNVTNIINIVKRYSNDKCIYAVNNNYEMTNNLQNIIVIVIIGGVTIDEINRIKKKGNDTNKRVIIITDLIISATSYVHKIITSTSL